MTTSSPSLADLDGDGVQDIVFGTGVDRVRPLRTGNFPTLEPDTSGYVVAVSGATNRVLWRVASPRDAFTTPRLLPLNGDRVPDVVMGGREGILTAFDGTNGAVLWRLDGKAVAPSPFPYCFFTPAVIADANGDGVPDLVAAYGGNDTRTPKDPRDSAYVVVVSGADGKVLKVQPLPDGAETYASPVVYRRRDGAEWVVLGTGGETHGGAEYRAPVASLLDGSFATRAERLVPVGPKGVIAPPTVLDLTGDGEPDLVVSTFDGRLVALDGASAKPIWERTNPSEETYHQPAVVRLPEGKLGLFVSRGVGVFPKYVASIHTLYDAKDGHVLYEHRDPNYPAGAPLAVDLTGDGVDEPIFFSVRFPSGQGSRVYVLHVATRRLIAHELPQNLWSTPLVADVRGKGTLELAGPAWKILEGPGSDTLPAWRNLKWSLLRLDLAATAPPFRAWGAYMGTSSDGQYHPPEAKR